MPAYISDRSAPFLPLCLTLFLSPFPPSLFFLPLSLSKLSLCISLSLCFTLSHSLSPSLRPQAQEHNGDLNFFTKNKGLQPQVGSFIMPQSSVFFCGSLIIFIQQRFIKSSFSKRLSNGSIQWGSIYMQLQYHLEII